METEVFFIKDGVLHKKIYNSLPSSIAVLSPTNEFDDYNRNTSGLTTSRANITELRIFRFRVSPYCADVVYIAGENENIAKFILIKSLYPSKYLCRG